MITDVLDIISQKAIEMSWIPLIVNARSTDYEVNGTDITDGSIIALISRNGSAQMQITGQSYNGDINHAIQVIIYRKFESETISSVSETYKQKYDNRLLELYGEMVAFISDKISCSTELELLSVGLDEVVNKTSASMDGIQAILSIKTWNQYGT